MIRLEVATVLLQWSVGGLFFLWVTTRRRELGIGYGWTLRITYGLMAVLALAAGLAMDTDPVREAASAGVALAAAVALAVSVARRKAGVAGEHERRRRRAERVAAMTADRPPAGRATGRTAGADPAAGPRGPEFPPALDLVAPAIGVVGLVAAALAAGGPAPLALLRVFAGAAFLGAVSDAMLLGHWYLVQPGLGRAPLVELVRWATVTWPVEVGALLIPTGMLSVLAGTIDDGYGGLLGWFWVACAVTTIGLLIVTRLALRERYYSAVMAATGLLYLGILTAFGTDLVARALLAP